MTFGTLKAYTALALGNLRDSDPYYLLLDWAVNSAIKEVPKRRLLVKDDYGQFPELKTSWREQTVADTHEYALAANCLVITDVFSLDYSGTFLGEGVGVSRKLEWLDHDAFEVLNRDTEGLPRNWTMNGSNMKLWPTPTTSNLTWYRQFGLKLEADITLDATSPALRSHWHNGIVFYAAYLLAGMKGWKDRAAHFFAMFQEAIGGGIDPTAALLSHQDGGIIVVGDPSGN